MCDWLYTSYSFIMYVLEMNKYDNPGLGCATLIVVLVIMVAVLVFIGR